MAKKVKSGSVISKKIFVLDTSVILYDHDAINNFQEHDVAIPIQVLEELDNFKSGNDTRNFEARSFIRLIDQTSKQKLISDWVALNRLNSGMFKVVLNESPLKTNAEEIFGKGKTDHKILNAALSLKEQNPNKKVILVSKDICLRLKAKALDLNAEDYETGKIKNVDELYAGKTEIANFDEAIIDEVKQKTFANVAESSLPLRNGNHFYILKNKRKTANVFYNNSLKTISSVSTDAVFKIKPKNTEQAFAINALLDPNIKLVSIQGNAGTGKTLLALASALEQRRDFRQIYVTRPIVSLSNKDIGFLPGDAKSKIDPFMAPIWDNLRFIKEQFSGDEKMVAKIDELISTEKIAIAPLAFIRGRTLTKIFFIIDEAQNLTPHEVKTIISRAGEQTKIVFTGDIIKLIHLISIQKAMGYHI